MGIVFAEYTQEQLNHEYEGSATPEDRSRYFTDWRRRSAHARERLNCSTDISYGPAAGQTLDIFFSGRKNAPIQIFFHGGYWRSQDKSNFSFVAEPFVKEGITVIAANYDLCPSVRISTILDQARSSIAWVYKNAPVFGGDPDSIAIYGHSAGAHITASMLETDWTQYGAPENVIKAATAISGLYHLEPVRLSSVNADLRLDLPEALLCSPHLHTPRRRVPFVLSAGADETNEFRRQTADYAAALTGRSYQVEHLVVPNADHYEILDNAIDLDDPLGKALLAQALGTD